MVSNGGQYIYDLNQVKKNQFIFFIIRKKNIYNKIIILSNNRWKLRIYKKTNIIQKETFESKILNKI